MTELPASAVAGLALACPRCGAAPGESCINAKDGGYRQTTHQERKDIAP